MVRYRKRFPEKNNGSQENKTIYGIILQKS